ncbi:cytochrome P450 [Novosphingobium mangrovi (ex Huang et al. 2023)]|uniref:Cytochrome P450 n=1 Tax=Novosphingobium mangrovi (ex Huang et al. 2023) TaxID=2976432 RepID=A0ABT2I0N4_9SPHN|nr:cytochrome P450 [Novosphingobium mangrovi (ex Huang et al. 2023)]MCT2398355.1 cytochrome P450 [Novosphingobium mangrovi (ex Huang et al. 2023)]
MASAAQLVEKDYFTDHSVLLDPYDYFESIRAHGPVYQMRSRDVVVVTGFAEALEVLLNTRDFSSWLNPDPLVALPFEVEGDDIAAQLASVPSSPMELMVSYDGDRHAAARSLLNPLFTPSRLKANEAFMRAYAEDMVRKVVAAGGCELVNKVATPFVTMVIADLLGVPAEDREAFREVIDAAPPPGNMDAPGSDDVIHPLMVMAGYFTRYVAERRAQPRDDVMTEMALAKYPDGSTPDAMEVVKSAMFLFAAGQDTSAKLIGNSMRRLAEDQVLQQQLREDRTLIGPFLEEVLRLEGSTKATFRIASCKTRIGDVEIPAGKRVVVSLSAANRDPRRWDDPGTFRIGRPRIKEHLAFGRGAHTCAGAPLARAEVAVILERFLDHTTSITLDEAHHGPAGTRTIEYEPSYIIRGLANLHIKLA